MSLKDNNLNLEQWIIKDLSKSGLTPDNFPIESLKNESELRERLGVTNLKIIEIGGYWIPYPNVQGFYRLKLKTEKYTESRKTKYLSPKKELGFGNHAFIPSQVDKLAKSYNPDEPLFFTEGEKKAAKATIEGFPTIGLAGVFCFKDSENDFITDLEKLNLTNRNAYIAFDSDIVNKTQIRQAELKLAVEFINRKAKPISIRLPEGENGDKNGLDDFLVRYGKHALQNLINKSEETIELLIKEGTQSNLILSEISRISSSTEKSKYVKLLADREGVNVRDIVNDLKRLEPITERSEKKSYLAVFDGLVDIVDQDGAMMYLVKDGSDLLLEKAMDVEGKIYYPPPRENLPFDYIPRAEEVLKYYKTDTNIELYNNLREYHKNISELPTESHYDLLTSWDFLTYLIESVQYLPYIWLYAIPERGKSRTGKGCIYVAYRGIHVESLREAYLLRASNDLRATIFFDVMNLSKKAEKAGSEDILLQRFEKGPTVPRVLYPDRGPHRDTVYYDVFGSTLIATNEPVHEILETRALMLSMPESSNTYEGDVRPEDGFRFKERLLAFRARHLGEELPEAQKPAKGRLGDLVKPLLQVIRLVNPERESAFINLIIDIENERKEHRSESIEARLVKAIDGLEDEVKDGLLPIKLITDQVNKNVKEKYQTTTKSVGWKLNALGFIKRKRSHGSCIQWDETLIEKLKERYGLDTEKIVEERGEIKHHIRQERHSANTDNGFENDILPGDFKTSQKLHCLNPHKQNTGYVYDDSDVFSNDIQKQIDDFIEGAD